VRVWFASFNFHGAAAAAGGAEEFLDIPTDLGLDVVD
jgi:hypothetical protein